MTKNLHYPPDFILLLQEIVHILRENGYHGNILRHSGYHGNILRHSGCHGNI